VERWDRHLRSEPAWNLLAVGDSAGVLSDIPQFDLELPCTHVILAAISREVKFYYWFKILHLTLSPIFPVDKQAY